jgi:hypothetical protein
MTQLAGQFAIQTVLKATYLTAVDGGGQTTNAIYTNVWQTVGPNEKFTLWVSGNPYYAFQTANGSYLTAVNGGGLTTNAVETAPKQLNAWALFKLVPSYNAADSPPFPVAIQTLRGFFLTAVGGGGQRRCHPRGWYKGAIMGVLPRAERRRAWVGLLVYHYGAI